MSDLTDSMAYQIGFGIIESTAPIAIILIMMYTGLYLWVLPFGIIAITAGLCILKGSRLRITEILSYFASILVAVGVYLYLVQQ